ncbi:MAG TPA: hypothetical protein VFT51_15235 [Bacillales bacterium]|nr:hypothetical protein [Bacillales bacterium]
MLIFLIGLILLAAAVFQMLKVRTFGFQNKKVLMRKRITVFLGGAGLVLILFGFLSLTLV